MQNHVDSSSSESEYERRERVIVMDKLYLNQLTGYIQMWLVVLRNYHWENCGTSLQELMSSVSSCTVGVIRRIYETRNGSIEMIYEMETLFSLKRKHEHVWIEIY